jgi:hypothetical protein
LELHNLIFGTVKDQLDVYEISSLAPPASLLERIAKEKGV